MAYIGLLPPICSISSCCCCRSTSALVVAGVYPENADSRKLKVDDRVAGQSQRSGENCYLF
jgi:hypothetical protein